MRDLDREALFRLLSALSVTPRDIDERPALVRKPVLPAVFKRPDRIAIPPPFVARMAKSDHDSLAEGFDRVNPRHFPQKIPRGLKLLDNDARSLELRAWKDENQVVSAHDPVAFGVSDVPAGVFPVLRRSLISRDVHFVGLDRGRRNHTSRQRWERSDSHGRSLGLSGPPLGAASPDSFAQTFERICFTRCQASVRAFALSGIAPGCSPVRINPWPAPR
jgi:hypothetical protein